MAYQKISEDWQATPPEARIDALFCEYNILVIGLLKAQLAQKQPDNLAVIELDEIEQVSSSVCQLRSGFVK